jgi:Flp pilus assembly pilin Flp
MNILFSDFISNEDGQGITEYGAILAFVAILVAVVFSVTQGALSGAISKAFSSVVKQLNALSTAAASAS